MKHRVLWIVAWGLSGFLTLGATAAAADGLITQSASEKGRLAICADYNDESELVALGDPNCSIRRVSPSFGKQQMAFSLAGERTVED